MMVTPYVRQDRSRSKPASINSYDGKLEVSQNFSCQVTGKSLRQMVSVSFTGKSAICIVTNL